MKKTSKKTNKKKDDSLFAGEELYEGIFGLLGLLIIGIGKFIVFTGVFVIGVASAISGLGFLLFFPPFGVVCITPLLIIIFGKKEFLKKFM